jgi:Sec-independent protein translocase protein TatA
MGSLGFDELLVVILVAIIVFGKNLPQVARKVGQYYARFKRHISDLKDDFQRQMPDIEEDVKAPEPPPAAPDPPPPLGTTPSANLPGPDPGDPEYRGQDVEKKPPEFDPAKPPSPPNGNGHTEGSSSPAPASESKPPDSPPPSGGAASPPTPAA